MNLILLEPDEIKADGIAVLSGNRARHVREVLQASPGGGIRVGVVDGPMGLAMVIEDAGELRLQCLLSNEIPPVPRVDVLLAMPRPKVMNRLWPVLASLGVGRILISNAWKTERNYFDTHVLEPEHIRAGLIEGLQQARDTRLPQVSVHRQFKKLVEDELDGFGPYAARLVAHPGAGAFPALGGFAKGCPHLAGRRARRRLDAVRAGVARRHGFEPVSWGPRALRTDTACAVLLGLVHAALH